MYLWFNSVAGLALAQIILFMYSGDISFIEQGNNRLITGTSHFLKKEFVFGEASGSTKLRVWVIIASLLLSIVWQTMRLQSY